MRYLSVYMTAERSTPPTEQHMADMGKLIESGMKAGWLISTEGCLPSALGARIRSTDGKTTVNDGPFTESKEMIGGFAIIEAKSKAEAIQLTKDFLKVAGADGVCELRQLYEGPPQTTR